MEIHVGPLHAIVSFCHEREKMLREGRLHACYNILSLPIKRLPFNFIVKSWIMDIFLMTTPILNLLYIFEFLAGRASEKDQLWIHSN